MKSSILSELLVATLTAVVTVCCGVDIPAAPTEVPLSEEVRIEVRDGFRWKSVPALLALTADGYGNRAVLPDSIMAEFGGIAKVPRVVPCAAASAGSRHGATFRVSFGGGEWLKARVRPDGKALVFAPGEYVRCAALSLYDSARSPDVDGYSNVEVFGPGWHCAQNDSRISEDGHGNPVVRVGDDTAVILEAGAHVCAAFEVCGSSHVKICGPGWINLLDRCQGAGEGFRGELWGGFRKGALPAVYTHRGARDITVDGPGIIADFRAVCGRCSEDITVLNATLLTSAANGDGLNFINCRRVGVEGLLVHSQDDCVALFNNCDSIRHLWDPDFDWPAVTGDVSVEDCILWTTCRPFCIGGHGTGSTDPRDTVEKVLVRGCKVYQAYELSGDRSEKAMNRLERWGGTFRVLSQSGQSVRDIEFADIDCFWVPGYLGQPFHLCVRDGDSTSYGEGAGYEIRDVRFRNIRFHGVPSFYLPPYFHEPEPCPEGGLKDISFLNILYL